MLNPSSTQAKPVYETPVVTVIGSVYELTQQGCDKRLNGSDGFTFMGIPIVCRSA